MRQRSLFLAIAAVCLLSATGPASAQQLAVAPRRRAVRPARGAALVSCPQPALSPSLLPLQLACAWRCHWLRCGCGSGRRTSSGASHTSLLEACSSSDDGCTMMLLAAISSRAAASMGTLMRA